MYFLIQLIKQKRTVVYESVSRSHRWVFRGDGRSYAVNVKTFTPPELDDKETVYIFDSNLSKRAYEPKHHSARLIYISSTNSNRGKEVKRRCNFLPPLMFPSTTREEFDRYAAVFGVSCGDAREIAMKFGHGQLLPLVHEGAEDFLDESIDESTLDMLSIGTFLPSTTKVPPMWINGYLSQWENESDLLQVYKYRNSVWDFASSYVVQRFLKHFSEGEAESKLLDLFIAVTDEVDRKRLFGPLCKRLTDLFFPKLIVRKVCVVRV